MAIGATADAAKWRHVAYCSILFLNASFKAAAGQELKHGKSYAGRSLQRVGVDGPRWKGGAFQSYSHDLGAELDNLTALLRLKPGLSYCEMGAGNGLFSAALGKAVMPGGAIYATSPHQAELDAVKSAVTQVGLQANVFQANDTSMGLPPASCDVIFSRMTYHMVKPGPAVLVYLPQLRAALKSRGRILILDHDADNGATTRDGAKLKDMKVVPMLQEIREFTSAGFALVKVIDSWPFFGKDEHGFGLLWMDSEPREVAFPGSGTKKATSVQKRLHDGAQVQFIVGVLAGAAFTTIISCVVLCLVMRSQREVNKARQLSESAPLGKTYAPDGVE